LYLFKLFYIIHNLYSEFTGTFFQFQMRHKLNYCRQ